MNSAYADYRAEKKEREIIEKNEKEKEEDHELDPFSWMKTIHVQVPQQSNGCDCGVYVLHYIEKFLKAPFPDLREFAVHRPAWFPTRDIAAKRENIKALIKKLAK